MTRDDHWAALLTRDYLRAMLRRQFQQLVVATVIACAALAFIVWMAVR